MILTNSSLWRLQYRACSFALALAFKLYSMHVFISNNTVFCLLKNFTILFCKSTITGKWLWNAIRRDNIYIYICSTISMLYRSYIVTVTWKRINDPVVLANFPLNISDDNITTVYFRLLYLSYVRFSIIKHHI